MREGKKTSARALNSRTFTRRQTTRVGRGNATGNGGSQILYYYDGGGGDGCHGGGGGVIGERTHILLLL